MPVTSTSDPTPAQLKARRQLADNRLRYREHKRLRKRDTRRKVIVGELAMTHGLQHDGFRQAFMLLLDQHVEMDGKRALYGLGPKGQGKPWGRMKTGLTVQEERHRWIIAGAVILDHAAAGSRLRNAVFTMLDYFVPQEDRHLFPELEAGDTG